MDYSYLVETYELLDKTSSRLGKVGAIALLLEKADAKILPKITMLLQGVVFPAWSDKELGIAQQLMIKAIYKATGFPENEVMKLFASEGDLGLVIELLVKKKKQLTLARKKLSVEKVFENMQAIASIEGKGAVEKKLSLVTELLSFASPKEAKYIARTTLGTLRIGVAEGVVRDAIAKAFFSDIIWGPRTQDVLGLGGRKVVIEDCLVEQLEKKHSLEDFMKGNMVVVKSSDEIKSIDFWKPCKGPDFVLVQNGSDLKKRIIDAVEMAWFLRPDFGEVAGIAKQSGLEGLKAVDLKVGQPYHVLLSDKAKSLEKALKTYEKVVLEWKYDGARICIHKSGDKIWLFTRRLEDVTKQFPEVVEWSRKAIKAKQAIVEGEMLGFSKGKPMPFQFLSRRIKRKYDIEKIAKEIPVQVNLFEVVFLNGKNLFRVPQKERWEVLKKNVVPIPNKFQFAKHLETKDLEKAEAFYKQALAAGQEGLIVKNVDAHYQPGRRVGYWLKVKPTMENLDLVIVGATWGTGKRAKWMGSFVLGCRSESGFMECGKIGTGIKEKGEGVTFDELTKILEPCIQGESGNELKIRPKVVVEVAYEEIQKSPNYASGFALRFPRVVRVRPDKSLQQVDSKDRLKRLFFLQANRGINK